MSKKKRKLTAAEKRAKAERRKKYEWILGNGKQVRVECPRTVDRMDVDEFIRRNADPVWRHQNEMWELIDGDDNHSEGDHGRLSLDPTTDHSEARIKPGV